ncbi:MAG: TIGR03621 family F420-dependent LLM class oxidoreductase [Myxococcota bacterium]|nr:TIGR03621 family F420-dependent LLM class oxidoreductase [Myxococcota bacterium]
MTRNRPFRFAVQAFSAPSAKEWREKAQRAEGLGYSALHLADHFLGPGPALEQTQHPLQELAAVPAMAAAAAATNTLRVGCRVFCIDYRHPVVLAKEAATLDLLSEGRLELGLGAGWLRSEYEAAGLVFDPAGQRIARLAEVIGALKLFFAGEPLDIAGEHVRWTGFSGVPRPVQRPHPPLMIGGGSRRILELAAREADVVSLNFDNRSGKLGRDGVHSGSADRTTEKIGWVREAAGDRFDDIELEIGTYFTFVTDQPEPIVKGMAGAFGLSPEEMLAHPHGLFGEPAAICDELERRREAWGISYVTVPDDAAEAFAPVVAKLSGR